ncbi:MAG: methyltransferase [Acidobacteriaceae bacterium]
MMHPDPVTQLQLLTGGYYVSRCLQVAAALGSADLIAGEAVAAETLASATGTHAAALGRVLSLLCAHGVFVRSGEAFGHSELSQLLRTDHPQSMRAFARMFGIPVLWNATVRLDESVRTGEPMADKVTPGGLWRYFEGHPEDSAKFNAAMQAKAHAVTGMVAASYDFTRYARIADIGGGRGHLLQALLAASPHSTGVLFDQPHVVAEAAGIASERLELRGGDFFTDPLPEANLHVLMEVIHDWDDLQSERILRSVRAASRAGGRIALVEAMMPEKPVPCWTTTLDVVMLNLLGGRQRNLKEYTELLHRCGFKDVREIPVGAGHSLIEASAG